MLLVHKDIPHMPLTELDNDSESVWVKLFVNKKTHFVASWYRPPVDGHLPVSDNGNDLLNSLEKFDNLFREQLDKIKNINKGNKPPLIHVLGNFNFKRYCMAGQTQQIWVIIESDGGSDFDRYHE